MASHSDTFTQEPSVIMPSISKRFRHVAIGSIKQWIKHRAGSKGAALAFYTLFSMAPILILVIAIAGAFFGQDAARGALYGQIKTLVGSTGAQAIQLLVAGAKNPETGRIAAIGASITLIIGATSVFTELKESIDEIWQVPPTSSGAFALFKARLKSFGVIVILAFLLMVSLIISAVLGFLDHYLNYWWPSASLILTPVTALFSFTVIAGLFAAIYKLLPHIRLSWKDVGIGSLGTAGLFMLGKYLIGLYLKSSGVADSYGAAGSVIVLLLWVYYSAQIFFLGAIFTQQYALWFGSLICLNKELTRYTGTVQK